MLEKLPGAASSGPGTAGVASSVSDHVSRRMPNTALAVVLGSLSWDSSISQCWLVRFVRTMRAVISNAPSAIGARKFTVNASGSPTTSG